MKDVYEFAKYFIKIGADSKPDTYDGNMKLQKLLVMAYVIFLALYDEEMFNDEILAFENGCVVEKIRLRYRNDYSSFKRDSDNFQPDFTEREYYVLNLTNKIFGDMSAKELSRLNHTFLFWQESYKNGQDDTGYHDKKKSAVDFSSYQGDLQTMREIVDAYNASSVSNDSMEVINGIKFFYSNMILTDDTINKLARFADTAEDSSYSVYVDNGELVIY